MEIDTRIFFFLFFIFYPFIFGTWKLFRREQFCLFFIYLVLFFSLKSVSRQTSLKSHFHRRKTVPETCEAPRREQLFSHFLLFFTFYFVTLVVIMTNFFVALCFVFISSFLFLPFLSLCLPKILPSIL